MCKRTALSLWLLVFTLSPNSPALPDGIIGDRDDRVEVRFPETPGSQFLGAITDHGELVGTGFLVGPRHMLSAAHVWAKITGANGKPNPKGIEFHLHYANGRATHVVTIRNVDYWGGYQSGTTKDWVLAVLEEPVGLQFGWLDFSPNHPKEAVRIHSYGYGRDFNGRGLPTVGSVHFNCRTFTHIYNETTQAGQIATDCDGPRGSSGGPNVFEVQYPGAQYKKRFQLVGVNSRYDGDYTYYVPTSLLYSKWLRSVAWRMEHELDVAISFLVKQLAPNMVAPSDRPEMEALAPRAEKMEAQLARLNEEDIQEYYAGLLGQDWMAQLPQYLLDVKTVHDISLLPFQNHSVGVSFTDEFAPLTVLKIEKDSAADTAGLLPGDKILSLSGELLFDQTHREVTYPNLLRLKAFVFLVGGKFTLSISRAGIRRDIRMEVAELSEEARKAALAEKNLLLKKLMQKYGSLK